MTMIQRVAQVFGIGFLLVAVAGFVASGMSMDPNPVTAPKVFGLFPVNVIHNLVHAAFGIWGLAASRSFGASKSFATISGVLYLILMGIGFIFPTGFGLVPLGGNDLWLHLVLGVALLGFGIAAKDVPRRDTVGA